MRISVELVPRSEASLDRQLEQVRTHLKSVDTINIPDIYRFDMRSWEGCARARRFFTNTIPHLRAIDVDLARPLAVAPSLRRYGIREVLVVAGDAPVDLSRTVYDSSSIEVIRKLRREVPEVRVYAALDPYRHSFLKEREYARRKLEAGAVGLFSQPFFDVRLMEIYRELLAGVEIFWGVTSVVSERSLRYWQTRNRVFFPASFEPTLSWNRAFAERALAFARESDSNIYFMPISAGVREYLGGLL